MSYMHCSAIGNARLTFSQQKDIKETDTTKKLWKFQKTADLVKQNIVKISDLQIRHSSQLSLGNFT